LRRTLHNAEALAPIDGWSVWVRASVITRGPVTTRP